MKKLFTFTGCIATGKSTLAEAYSDKHSYDLIREGCERNPYLEDYYKNMSLHSYKMQSWFLNNRIAHLIKLRNKENVVQDQMIHAFGYIFPTIQKKLGFMESNEFASILRSFDLFLDHNKEAAGMPSDEILIYLRVRIEDVGKVIRRIKFRNRECEKNISEEYLLMLITEYEDWFERIKSTLRVIELDPFEQIRANLEIIDQSIEDQNNVRRFGGF